MTKLSLLISLFALSFATAAQSQESRTPESALALFLSQLPKLSIAKNFDGSAPQEVSAAKAFAASLLKASGVTANCQFIQKSLREDCHVMVHEGKGGEGVGGAEAVFGFSVLKDNIEGDVTLIFAI